ncbi:unnamed protein product [Durusdinium trenchii]|uniref:Mitochondrial (MCT) (Mitochondrial malonyl CoA:ACP acyltransferase) (Mitochondrial malonyltransferase) ([Acyl-carrier-protein] malonyltransferase) n=2 Tax=Durusdinium trenchii TaxID=1381693 RepID=A0ABP0HKV0_9DINO
MDAWDPFLDPADDGLPCVKEIVKVEVTDVPVDLPVDPWNDNTFVALAQEAAREAEERYEAALKALEAQQAADLEEKEAKEARRQKLEREARELAKLSPQERREKLLERQAYAEMALEAIAQSPAIAMQRKSKHHRDLEEPEELAFGRAAAEIAAAEMGVKINFKSKDEATRPVALLFPDQNSKSLKMLKGLQELPEARRFRETARELLGFDPLDGPGVLGFYELLRGPEGWLEHTQFCQPVMYVAQVAAVEKLRDKRPGALQRCKAVAGLSLGDYAALTFAGVWDFQTGLRATQLRGELMEAAIATIPQAAVAVAGLTEERISQLCEECRESSICEIAQRLFPQGYVCSGSLEAIERLMDRARRSQGCKQVQLLKLAGACHTRLMASAREELFEFLQSFKSHMRPPRIDVYLSCGTKVPAGSSIDSLPELLADQLRSPANWVDSIAQMLQDGCGEFYECGPLNQLKCIMKRIDAKAHKATVSLDVYSEESQMKPSGSLPPRWAEGSAGCLS